MKLALRLFFLLPIVMLAGCENDSAAYRVGTTDEALTLMRESSLPWSDTVDLSLVVARMPDCQRRHHLKPQPAASSRVDIYEVRPRIYRIRQGKNWYAAETDTCTLEATPAQQPESAGTLIGSFQKRDDKLMFEPAQRDG